MTPAERLARAIVLSDQLTDAQRMLTATQRVLASIRSAVIEELADAKADAVRREDQMPTNVQPEPARIQ